MSVGTGNKRIKYDSPSVSCYGKCGVILKQQQHNKLPKPKGYFEHAIQKHGFNLDTATKYLLKIEELIRRCKGLIFGGFVRDYLVPRYILKTHCQSLLRCDQAGLFDAIRLDVHVNGLLHQELWLIVASYWEDEEYVIQHMDFKDMDVCFPSQKACDDFLQILVESKYDFEPCPATDLRWKHEAKHPFEMYGDSKNFELEDYLVELPGTYTDYPFRRIQWMLRPNSENKRFKEKKTEKENEYEEPKQLGLLLDTCWPHEKLTKFRQRGLDYWCNALEYDPELGLGENHCREPTIKALRLVSRLINNDIERKLYSVEEIIQQIKERRAITTTQLLYFCKQDGLDRCKVERMHDELHFCVERMHDELHFCVVLHDSSDEFPLPKHQFDFHPPECVCHSIKI